MGQKWALCSLAALAALTQMSHVITAYSTITYSILSHGSAFYLPVTIFGSNQQKIKGNRLKASRAVLHVS